MTKVGSPLQVVPRFHVTKKGLKNVVDVAPRRAAIPRDLVDCTKFAGLLNCIALVDRMPPACFICLSQTGDLA